MAGCGGKKRGKVCSTPDSWSVIFDVPDFEPNELCVKVSDTSVEVRGKKADGCNNFTERYELPCDVDPCTVNWQFADCKLTVTACKKKC